MKPWWMVSPPAPSQKKLLKPARTLHGVSSKDQPRSQRHSKRFESWQQWSYRAWEVARSWQKLERTQTSQARSGALSGERFQDVCQGHSQDVYPWTAGARGSALDSSSLVRQIGKGNSLGENALTIHVSFGFWVHLRQQGHSPLPNFWTKVMER